MSHVSRNIILIMCDIVGHRAKNNRPFSQTWRQSSKGTPSTRSASSNWGAYINPQHGAPVQDVQTDLRGQKREKRHHSDLVRQKVPRAHCLGPKISGMAWIGMDWRVPPIACATPFCLKDWMLASCAAVLPNVVPFKGMHILLSERADLRTI